MKNGVGCFNAQNEVFNVNLLYVIFDFILKTSWTTEFMPCQKPLSVSVVSETIKNDFYLFFFLGEQNLVKID